MNLRHIGLVLGKEVVNTIRDRRTMIAMFVIPLVFMPLVIFGPSLLLASQEESKQREAQQIAVINGAEAPEIVAALEQSQTAQLAIVAVPDPRASLLDGEISAILVIPSGFIRAVESEASPPGITIEYDLSSTSSEVAVEKLERVLARYYDEVVRARLEQRGIPTDLVRPFAYQSVNVAPEERVSGYFLSLILPLFLVLYAAIGGAQTAIDVTAGEKERGTLESLLVTPPGRSSFVFGKYLTVFAVTLVATGLSLAGFAISLSLGSSIFADNRVFEVFKLAISAQNLALLFGTTAIIAAMTSGLSMALFIWTRNFKEAQTYTTYLSFAIMIPAFAVSFMDPPTQMQSYLIPIYNGAAVIKELLLGTVDWSHIGLTFASSFIIAVAGLLLSIRMFSSEKVLFRQ